MMLYIKLQRPHHISDYIHSYSRLPKLCYT